MKRNEMIKSHQDFTNIIKKEKYLKNNNFSIYIRKSNNNYPHFGIAVSKRLGNAVMRNKLKRRMRNIIDDYKKQLPDNEDYIIIMKENTKNLSYNEMQDSFQKLLNKRRNNETTK